MEQHVTQLRLRWLLTTILYCTVAVIGYRTIQSTLPHYANSWVGWTLIALLIHLGILWWGLPRNHRNTEQTLLPTLGFGNAITLLRGLLVGLMGGFLFMPQPQDPLLAWTPALLYTSAILLDYFDGFVARITNHATRLGEMLDMEFDGLGILLAIALAIQYGQIPFWYLLLGFGRPLFILGLSIRHRLGLPNYEMTESNNRRLIAGFQMAFLSVMLWPILDPPLTTLACLLFSIPLAASFLRDWLVVSGQINPLSATYIYRRDLAKTLIESWSPLLLRAIGFCAFALILYRFQFSLSAAWRDLLNEPALPIILPLLDTLAWIAPAAAIALLLGVLGRTSSIVLVGVVAVNAILLGLGGAEAILLICTMWVLQFGSGSCALWPAEERFLNRRAGLN